MPRWFSARAIGAGLLAVAGCQSVLGIEDWTPKSAPSESCTLNTDCPEDLVCVFAKCSVECRTDRDCVEQGRRCLTLDSGTSGCVSPTEAACTADSCESGTECHDGECRTPCSIGCRTDQSCVDGVCIGTDEGGTGGTAGSSSGGKGGSAGRTGGSGGIGGEDQGEGGAAATGGAAGRGGTAGAGGSIGGSAGTGGSAGSGGSGGSDPCDGIACDEQMNPECADDGTLRTYEAVGTCTDGTCDYSYVEDDCEFGCSGDACNADPCIGVVCDDPPDNGCQDSTHFVAYSTSGTCAEGTCEYSSNVIDCECEDDACTTDPCETVVCNAPPAPSCFDAGTRRTYSANGTCSGGSCSYAPTNTPCEFGCSGGACNADPCAGVTCSNPPGASCISTTLRTYEQNGSCSLGVCSYDSTDTSCTHVCSMAMCRCNPGYSGSGVGANGCADIDECTQNTDDCDTSPVATCGNTAGSYNCSCPAGYSGNGHGANGCTDIDECTQNTDDCDTSPVATCGNTSGGYNCSCPSPYTGNGHGSSGCTCPAVTACDAAGEMSGSYCSSQTVRATCTNTNGCQVHSSSTCTNLAAERCVGAHPNAKCEIVAGYPTDNADPPGNLLTTTLLGVPFTVSQSITLTRLGFIASAASSGVRLAVYQDSGGVPFTWRASALMGTVVAGRNEIPVDDPPSSSPVTLVPGNYWIFIVGQATISLRQGAVGSVRYRTWSPWNNPFPTGSLTGTSSDSLARPNLYVVGTP
jgi:hypothetical protein